MTILLIVLGIVVGAVLGFLVAAEAIASAMGQAFGWGREGGSSLPFWLLAILVLGLLGWFIAQHVRIV